jgi:thousand and one amino acid protein kinase
MLLSSEFYYYCYPVPKFNKAFCRSQKENLKMAEAAEEQRLLRVQKNYVELEMRKFKRKKMCSLQDLENQLLRDASYKFKSSLPLGLDL